MVLGLGGNNVSCLIIVVIFIGPGGAKMWRDLMPSFGVVSHKSRGIVFMEEFSLYRADFLSY